jgi:hypothetical protein
VDLPLTSLVPGTGLWQGPGARLAALPAVVSGHGALIVLPEGSSESQVVSHGLDCAPAVGDLVLLLTGHLRVGAVADVAVGMKRAS